MLRMGRLRSPFKTGPRKLRLGCRTTGRVSFRVGGSYEGYEVRAVFLKEGGRFCPLPSLRISRSKFHAAESIGETRELLGV